jgi:hypothetical protein
MSQRTPINRLVILALLFSILIPRALLAQSTEISTEYLMTLHAPLDAPQVIDDSLFIYNVPDGGWVKGPKIEGKLRAPGADWLQVLADGTLKLDVRLTIETDDGALIYLSYNGVARFTDDILAKSQRGEVIESDEVYFITTPTMRTSSEKYGWLNHVQCIGKMIRTKSGEGAHVEYDIFIVR